MAAAEAWFITINHCDPVLSRYRFLEECGDPVAVGYAGIYGRNLLPADVNERIEEVNVTNIVGGTHEMSAVSVLAVYSGADARLRVVA